MIETTVGVRELKSQLSEYLRRVKAGDTIVITERGKPIGRIVPENAERQLMLGEKVQRLLDSGEMEWNGQEPEFIEPIPLIRTDVSASDIIVEMRE